MNSFLQVSAALSTILYACLLAGGFGQARSDSVQRQALVFGGNGFLGSETVLALLEDGYSVTVVHRGSNYWDYASRVAPLVTHWQCDRWRLKECEQLARLQWVDVVVDFSTYSQECMISLIDMLTDKTGLFVYISSDSVYEVCVHAEHALTNGSREEDAVRPKDKATRRELSEADSYGHHKMAGEELLAEQRRNGGFPYVSLRLPDVIGARDNTRRCLAYQLWLLTHFALGVPLFVSDWLKTQKLSLVLSDDVAKAVANIVVRNDSSVMDRAYNLAFVETCTLAELLRMIADCMGMTDFEMSTRSPARSYLFPSVTRGPVNISAAQHKLDWHPTPLSEAVCSMVTFYATALREGHFPGDVESVVTYLARRVFPRNVEQEFRTLVKQIQCGGNQRTDDQHTDL